MRGGLETPPKKTMRYLDNGNKRLIGQIIFIVFLLIAILILFCGCVRKDFPIHVKTSIESSVTYDGREVIANTYMKPDEEFKAEVVEFAEKQVKKDKWKCFDIDYKRAVRLHHTYIALAIVYYWE